MEPRKLRVCVVGAGVSGLTALKEVLEEGHSAVCLERENVPGGVFTTGVAYDPMQLTVSAALHGVFVLSSAAGGGAPPLATPGVRRLPRAFSSAIRARPAHPSQLRGRDGEPRGGRFVRRRIHASGEDGPRSLRRRRDLPRRVPCRSAAHAGPPRRRDVPGRDHAHREVQGRGALPRQAGRVRRNGRDVRGRHEPDLRRGLGLPSGAAELSAPHLAPSVWRARDERWLHEPAAGWAPRQPMQQYYGKRVQADLESGDPHRQLISDWFIKAGFTGKSLQKNDDFVANLLKGKIRHVPHGVARLEGNTVHFTNGEHVEADVVMCCTGYEESSIPAQWLGGLEVKDVRRLFKHAFHPDLGPRLALIGWTRPFNGGVPACSEMIARYFALLCSGKRELPARPDLEKRIEEDLAHEEAAFSQSKPPRTLVDFTTFLDSVAELVDCAPKLTDYLDDPPLLYKLICGSSIATCYRLRGPGADPEMAREVILRLPVVRDAVDLALIPLALAGRVEDSAIPKIHEIVERQFASDTQLV